MASRNGTTCPSAYDEFVPLRLPFCQLHGCPVALLAHWSRLTLAPPAAMATSGPAACRAGTTSAITVPSMTSALIVLVRPTHLPALNMATTAFLFVPVEIPCWMGSPRELSS